MAPREITGRCLCGAVTYRVTGRPSSASICHCDDCQRQTGSTGSVLVTVREQELTIDGELSTYTTVGTDTGATRARKFCPVCGSPILSTLEELPGVVFLKAGTLDDRSWVRPSIEFWRSSAQTWLRRPRPRLRLRRGPSPRMTVLLRRMTR